MYSINLSMVYFCCSCRSQHPWYNQTCQLFCCVKLLSGVRNREGNGTNEVCSIIYFCNISIHFSTLAAWCSLAKQALAQTRYTGLVVACWFSWSRETSTVLPTNRLSCEFTVVRTLLLVLYTCMLPVVKSGF